MTSPARAPVERVLILHNTYQHRGGEDAVVESEAELLARHGLSVHTDLVSNDEIHTRNKAVVALETLWSSRQVKRLEGLVRTLRPDVVHVHNTFPLLSPAVYSTCQRLGVPVVQTLHNFRLACPQAMFLRDSVVCEDCLGKLPWPAVVHRCYRGSALQTLVSASNITVHRALGTYRTQVDRFIALNGNSRQKFIEMGLPADKVVVKPNFVEPVAEPQWAERAGGLFVGRLSTEKGMAALLGAWDLLSAQAPWSGASLKVVGKGEFEADWQQRGPEVYLGFKPLPEVIAEMRRSLYVLVPSICYENFPRTIVEAFSVGVPVIGSRMGAMAELIEDGVTGLLANPGDAQDLAAKMAWAHAHPQEMLAMGRLAYDTYLRRYTPAVNLTELLAIYQGVIRTR
jgi:glycosyltransferase involved in cell wall biosynthesis